jgi:predicted O-methyltransferase YrrM
MPALTPPIVAAYLDGLTRPPHPVLERIRAEGHAGGVPIVDPLTGALLHLITRTSGATRILEIGTAIGYSTVWMACALPPAGLLVSFERDAARATTARAYLAEAGLDDRVNVIVADAERYFHKLAGPFDLVFQDGDKTRYEAMLDPLAELLRPGGLLVTDNVLWDGEVVPGFAAEPIKNAADTAAIARYNEVLASHPRYATTWLTVGDGVAIAVRNSAGTGDQGLGTGR